MQDTNHFLRAAFQIGPWRVTRKVLLFVITFCVVIIFFGTVVLKTHMFDEDWEWGDDDDDDDEFFDNISGGDSVLYAIIGIAAIVAIIASIGCCMASFNSPEHLNDTGSVFTLSGITQPASTTPAPNATAPQALPRQHRQHRRSRTEEVKAHPPTSDYPQGPSYPVNPGYPPHPPPYSAPSYPPGGVANNAGGPPPAHTLADLPPPYAPGHFPNPR